MNYCLQKHTTRQFTYFIYYLFQDKFKIAKIIKIQEVHQKIHAKQFLLFYLNCFLFIIMSPNVMPHLIISRIVNANPKHESEPEMRTLK